MNLSARKRRHVDLRFHTRRHYLRGLDNLRGQQSVLDQEHVRVETRPFMPRSNLSDDAGKAYLAQIRHGALGYDYVVKLQELPRRKTHPPATTRRRVAYRQHGRLVRPLPGTGQLRALVAAS